MEQSKRATTYSDQSIHKAVRLKAMASNRSSSDIVNDALRIATFGRSYQRMRLESSRSRVAMAGWLVNIEKSTAVATTSASSSSRITHMLPVSTALV